MRRGGVALLAALVVVVVGAACDPPPAPVVLVANSTEFSSDTDPGDGVCASTTLYPPGGCTLLAAIQEGNALSAASGGGQVVIELPGNPNYGYNLASTPVVEVTGNLKLVDTSPYFLEIEVITFHVAAGATLEVDVDLIDRYNCQGGFCPPVGETRVDVDGTFILRNTRINEGGWHIVRVNPGGVAYLEGAWITGTLISGPTGGDGSQAFWNAGTLVLHETDIVVSGVLGSVTTVAEGRTVLSGTSIVSPARSSFGVAHPAWPVGGGDACGGTRLPESLGGNYAFDATCQLTGPGDVTGPY
jgi:hypothetical protein